MVTLRLSIGRLLARARATRFAADSRAVAAVEFAMVLPFLMIMAFATLEISDGITVKRKLTHVASSIGDLVAQSKVVSNGDMTNILNAGSAIIRPYPETPLKIVVSGVSIDASSNATVLWSDAQNTLPLPINSVYQLPESLKEPNTFLVVSEVTYTYTPTVAYLLTGDVPMSDVFYLKPRLTPKVCRPPQTATNC